MEYVIVGLCLFMTCVVGFFSFIYIDFSKKKKQSVPEDKAPDSESEPPFETDADILTTASESSGNPAITLFRTVQKNITVKLAVIFLLGFVCNLAACLSILRYDLPITTKISICMTLAMLIAALLIDSAIKKVPNIAIAAMLGFRAVLLLFEFFFQRESFLRIFLASVIGLVGWFVIMRILSIVTKSGIGMGDVKLISALGCLSGVAAAFYTLIYSMIIGMLTAIPLLVFKKKGLKDEIAFGPFIYIGYVLSLIIGTF